MKALGRFRNRPDAIVVVIGLVGVLAAVALWANGVRGVGIALLLGADVLACHLRASGRAPAPTG